MTNASPPEGSPPFDRPERLPELWALAWNRRDADALAALFDEDAEFVNVTGLWWHDREAIRKAHRYGLDVTFNASELTIRQVEVKRLRDDVAVVHARMRLTGQTPIGTVEHPGPRTTVFSFVLHRTDAGWRCASAQNTDVVPGKETHIVDDAGAFGSVDYRTR
ncbi:MAG: SgcJ/EcaC family oxidoreductase [Bacteroidota bacterium]